MEPPDVFFKKTGWTSSRSRAGEPSGPDGKDNAGTDRTSATGGSSSSDRSWGAPRTPSPVELADERARSPPADQSTDAYAA